MPLIVGLAWTGMGLAGYAAGAAIFRGRAGRTARAGRIVAGAVALTAWDLFLDPQMLAEGAWRWAHRGPYAGVPVTNFAGWLLVSGVVMTALDAVLGGPDRRTGPLLALYVVMAVMETIGFAAVFPHGRVIAVAGAVGMGVPAVAAVTGWRRARRG